MSNANIIPVPALRPDTTAPRKPGAETLRADKPAAEITVYPNPAKDRVNVAWKLPEGVSGTVKVFTATGARVAVADINGTRGAVVLDASDWAAGVYVCKYTGSDGATQNHKLVILK